MQRARIPAILFLAILVIATQLACVTGIGGERGTFDRTFTVTGPVRLEVHTAAGNVNVQRGAAGSVHIAGEFQVGNTFWGDSRERARRLTENPPIEQRGNLIIVGSEVSHALLRNARVSYDISVPEDSEVSSGTASGDQTIRDVKGPVRASSASGDVKVAGVARDVTLSAASGRLDARDIGGELHASSASGGLTMENIEGDVRAKAASGSVTIHNPGGRVEAKTASGHIEIRGAKADVRGRSVSGGVSVEGNAASGTLWEIGTVSGSVRLRLVEPVNVEVALESHSGSINTDLPITIQSKSRRELRGAIGKPDARIEVSTVSGSIGIQH